MQPVEHMQYGLIYGDVRILHDGRIVYVCPTIPGGAQIVLGTPNPRGWVSDRWTYEDPVDAVEAAILWDGTGDPDGWVRHQPSNRRRPGGDPDLEVVRP